MRLPGQQTKWRTCGGSKCCSTYSRAGNAEEESPKWTRFGSKAAPPSTNLSFQKDPDVNVKQLLLSGCQAHRITATKVSQQPPSLVNCVPSKNIYIGPKGTPTGWGRRKANCIQGMRCQKGQTQGTVKPRSTPGTPARLQSEVLASRLMQELAPWPAPQGVVPPSMTLAMLGLLGK